MTTMILVGILLIMLGICLFIRFTIATNNYANAFPTEAPLLNPYGWGVVGGIVIATIGIVLILYDTGALS